MRALDALVGCVHHCDGKPDPDVSGYPQVGLLPICSEVFGQLFQRVFYNISQLYVQQDGKRGEVVELLGTGLQVLMIFLPLHCLETLIQIIPEVVDIICVHYIHSNSRVRPLVPEVSD